MASLAEIIRVANGAIIGQTLQAHIPFMLSAHPKSSCEIGNKFSGRVWHDSQALVTLTSLWQVLQVAITGRKATLVFPKLRCRHGKRNIRACSFQRAACG
jgi:hypothetical protein